MKLYLLVLIILLTSLTKTSQAQQIIELDRFGVEANTFQNSSSAIQKVLESYQGKSNIIFKLPTGRIDLWPEGAAKKELYISNTTEDDTLPKVKNIAFWFEDMNQVALVGNNTLIVLHGKMVSFGALRCSELLIRGVRFDYERPTMSEMTIKSVSPTMIETEIHPDSRYVIENEKLAFYGEGWRNWKHHTILYSPGKELMQYSSIQPLIESKAVEASPFRVHFEGDFSQLSFQPGDVLTVRDPYRDNCGGFINLSKDIRLENVKMHYMHGLGIVSQFSENISMRKVTVAPREDSGRIIASFADCFHFSGCRGIIEIDSCYTSGSHDDPVNVHGTHLKINQINSDDKLRVRFMHHQTYGFEAFFEEDSIAFVDPKTLQAESFAKVANARMLNLREMEIELEGKLPAGAKVGSVIENLSWTPEVRITNNRFERTNTRGLLITTRRKVLIENNTFFHTGMHAILIANDASSWYESGPVTDVTIRNNVFENCGFNQTPGNHIIAIAPENHKLTKNAFVHRNIRIENNLFKSWDDPVLSARSVERLIFTGNQFIRTGILPIKESRPAFRLTACSKVLLRNNSFSQEWNSEVLLSSMSPKEVTTNLQLISQ